MRFKSTTLLLTLTALVALTFNASAQTKIGVINLKKVFDEFHETLDYNKKLQDRSAEFSENKKAQVEKYKAANEVFQNLALKLRDPALSESVKIEAKKSADEQWLEVKRIEQNMAQLDQVANQNLMNQRERFREKILVKIMEVIDRRAREQGFALLHNTSSEDIFRNPVIVFQQNLPDLTKEVLAELNAGR